MKKQPIKIFDETVLKLDRIDKINSFCIVNGIVWDLNYLDDINKIKFEFYYGPEELKFSKCLSYAQIGTMEMGGLNFGDYFITQLKEAFRLGGFTK